MGGSKTSTGSTEAEQRRQQQIKQGTAAVNKTFAGFTPEFYKGRETAYRDWANPQLEDQYGDAQKQLAFALARQFGGLEGSEAADRQAKLASQRALAETQVSSQAAGYKTAAQEAVERQRQNLIAQVQAGTDPATASNLAVSQAELLNQPDAFSELGPLFNNVTEGLAAATHPYGIAGAPGGATPRRAAAPAPTINRRKAFSVVT